MKKINYTYCLLITILLFTSCRQDEIAVSMEDEVLPELENVTFQFLITNELGDPIEAAQVSLNAEIYVSDENGIVITSPQNVSSLGTKFEIIASGYESLIKVVSGPTGSIKQEKVTLFKAINSIVSTGSSGAIDGGGIITLPSSLVTEDGTTYNGEVTVKHKYLDPDNKDFLQSAPGDLLALNTSGEYQQLASFGMYMIELYDTNGATLEIPDGSSAIIEFPIADRNKNDIGTSIPLWYFDEDSGLWKEDGIAQVQGEMLVAEVSHFTWWNCDLPYDFAVICLVFWDSDGEVMPGLEVEFSVNGASFGVAVTDANGAILAKIPVGEVVDLKYYLDGMEIGAQSVGPFNEDERKEIVNTDLNPTKISGVALDCDFNPVANGYGYITTNSGLTSIVLASNGSFVYYAPKIEHQLTLIDLNSSKFKEIDISEEEQVENLDLNEIVVCEEEFSTKVSGYVLLDTDADNVGDIPIHQASLEIKNVPDNTTTTVMTDENGYYEIELLPGILYRVKYKFVVEYSLIAAGDQSPDGNSNTTELTLGDQEIDVIAILNEHDSDNNFLAIPDGEGIISGTAMADTDNDGIGDLPLEWMKLYLNRSFWPDSYTLVESDGTYSTEAKSGYISLWNVDLLFFGYTSLMDWDISPDPEGDDSDKGPNFNIPIVVHNGINDTGNNFLIEHASKQTVLCRVMEDTDSDGVGDTPVENLQLNFKERSSGATLNQRKTDVLGLVALEIGSQYNEISISFSSSVYEVIDIIDTSPDSNPLIIGGDLTKMQINLEEGEWDAGNIFVVRQI